MTDETKDAKQSESAQVAEQPTQTSSEATSTSETQVTNSKEHAEPKDSSKKEPKLVPLEEVIKERQRRRELGQEVESLKAELEQVKAKVSATPDPVKELMADFGVDEDTAKKLHKHGLGARPVQQPDEIDSLKTRFQKKAEDVSQDYSDWNVLRDDMATILQKEFEKDPKRALSKNPEEYYLQAKLQREQKEKESSVREVIDKTNQKNLAAVESGKNSTGRPDTKPMKGTRAWLKSLSHDDFVKNHDYITAELARGGFKE